MHKGHQLIIDRMLKKHSPDNCLIIIGSSSSLNTRTPYSFAQRREMINRIYPDLKTIGLPDVAPEKETYHPQTVAEWLDQISALEKETGTVFIFYGGSRKDLKDLSKRFKTEVLANRQKEGKNLSASAVRNENGSEKENNNIDKRIMDIVKNPFF